MRNTGFAARRAPLQRSAMAAALALAAACGGGGGGGGGGEGCPAGCAPEQVCVGAQSCDEAAHTCLPGKRVPDGTDCGGGQVCVRGTCATFHCGDSMLDSGEECDDGNLANLDGCDASCRYELFLRMTTLTIEGARAPSFCEPRTNRLGTQVLTATALGQLNPLIREQIVAGNANVLVQLLGLDDLTGASAPYGLEAGILSAARDPEKGAWAGDTLDWWFRANPDGLDADGLPVARLGDGTLSSRALALGPSDATLPLSLGGDLAAMKLRSMRVAATLEGTPAPDLPAPPPERIQPALRVFQDLTGSGSGQGVCGNVTVESLAQIPVPEPLASGDFACSASCNGSRSYTYCGDGQPVGPGCSSLLDMIVGGCSVMTTLGSLSVCTPVANAQQPDVPGVAGGTVAPLALGPGGKVPDATTNGNQDGYSLYLKFDATRVHVTGKAP